MKFITINKQCKMLNLFVSSGWLMFDHLNRFSPFCEVRSLDSFLFLTLFFVIGIVGTYKGTKSRGARYVRRLFSYLYTFQCEVSWVRRSK